MAGKWKDPNMNLGLVYSKAQSLFPRPVCPSLHHKLKSLGKYLKTIYPPRYPDDLVWSITWMSGFVLFLKLYRWLQSTEFGNCYCRLFSAPSFWNIVCFIDVCTKSFISTCFLHTLDTISLNPKVGKSSKAEKESNCVANMCPKLCG